MFLFRSNERMAHNRKGPYRPIIQTWSQNVGRMLSRYPQGCEAWIVCSRCKTNEPVDLFKLCDRFGPLFSLWNRRPPCPTCGDGRFFTSHHSKGAFVWPMTTDEPWLTNDLHRVYEETKRRV